MPTLTSTTPDVVATLNNGSLQPVNTNPGGVVATFSGSPNIQGVSNMPGVNNVAQSSNTGGVNVNQTTGLNLGAGGPPPPYTSNKPLTSVIAAMGPKTPSQAGFGIGDFSGFGGTTSNNISPDNSGTLPDAFNVQYLNDQLNNAQGQAYDGLTGSSTDTTDRQALADNLINNAMSENKTLTGQLNDATTGPNDLRTQTSNYYNQMGIDDLVSQINQAQSDYYNTEAQKQLNYFNREDQFQGGGTKSFVSAVDNRDQRTLAVQSLAASIHLNALQNQLNTKMDAFKVFASQAQQQQQNTISSISQQLGLNKQDLAQGVSILNQIRQETQFDEQLGKQSIMQLVETVPGIASQLTPQEIKAMQSGQVPPSVVAKIGATYKDISAAQNQQRTNATSALDYSREISTLTSAALNAGIDTTSPQFQNLITNMMGQMQNSDAFSTPGSTFTPSNGDMRTDRNNNPTAMTTDVAAALGLQPGVDYTQGDPFSTPTGQTLYTAKLNGDPIQTTINAFDNAAQNGTPIFTTQSGQPRWSYINMSNQQWQSLTPDQKQQVVQAMYQHEGGSGALLNTGDTSGQLTGAASVYQNATDNYGDTQYLTEDKLYGDQNQKRIAQNALTSQGVAVISQKNGDVLKNIDSAKQNLQDFSTMIDNANIQPTSWYGRTYGAAEASLQSWLQTNGITGAYDTWYAQAVGLVSALKGTGSGQGGSARLFTNIEEFLPKKTDTVATAKAKIDSLNSMLDNGAKSILGKFYKDPTDTAAAQFGGSAINLQGGQ